MSKKKSGQKEELEWQDDKAIGSKAQADDGDVAKENVEHLASQAAGALAGLLDDDNVVIESEEVAAEEVESEELEFSEDDLAHLSGAEDDEPSAIVIEDDESEQMQFSAEGTELDEFQSAEIEEVEQVPEDRIVSIVESLLFATDRPQSVAVLKAAFKGTNVKSHHIRRALDQLQIEYAGVRRGVYLEEVAGGFQIRTKVDNLEYMRRTVKSRPFKVSGPALEVLAIVAYKQPIIKSQIDEIRGVESGHLLRALMEKGLVHFAGKSELPGKPMFYGTSRRFLEIFGLRNLNELPSLSEIDQLIPEGIGEVEEKETLDQLTGQLSKDAGSTYSEGEDELLKIAEDLQKVSTTTEFFEKEKARMKAERDLERARDLEEAMTVGELISDPDRRWLEKFRATQAMEAAAASAEAAVTSAEPTPEASADSAASAVGTAEAPPEASQI